MCHIDIIRIYSLKYILATCSISKLLLKLTIIMTNIRLSFSD